MILSIDRSKLMPGDWLHVRSNTRFGKLIRYALDVRKEIDDPSAWGNHDALVIARVDVPKALQDQYPDETLFTGDAQPWRNRIHPLSEYERRMNLPKEDPDFCEVRVLRPVAYTKERGLAASAWWVVNINDKIYNLTAFPMIVARCLFGQRTNVISGLNNIRFCTRSDSEAWRIGADCDVMGGNLDPTPRTVEKRLKNGGMTGDEPTMIEIRDVIVARIAIPVADM